MFQIRMNKLLQVLVITFLWTGCASSQTSIQQIDGNWYSPQWSYGYTLKNGVGIATSTNSPNFQVGQNIIQLSAISANTFTGQQVYTDGKFYRVNVTLYADGRLYFEGEKNAKWTMERLGATPTRPTANEQNTFYRNKLIGRWYRKLETNTRGATIVRQYVQDFLPNGTISQQSQWVTTTPDGQSSCLVNTSWEWTAVGNKIYQKKTAVHVTPDFLKNSSGQFVNDSASVRQACQPVQNIESESLLTTTVFTILRLDDKVNVTQYTNSTGGLSESTDYRVTQGLAHFKIK